MEFLDLDALAIHSGPFIRCAGNDFCWINVQGYDKIEIDGWVFILGLFFVVAMDSLLITLVFVFFMDTLFDKGVAAARDLHMGAKHSHVCRNFAL